MSHDSPGRLHVVTGNSVAELPPERPEPSAEPAPAGPPPVRLRVLIAAGTGLTVLLALLGSQPWQLPARDGGALSAVPQSLMSFLVLCAAACLWAAGRLTRPADLLRSPAAVRVWWGLLAGAALVAGAAALSLASYARSGGPTGSLVAHCFVPLVPAVLAGVLASDAGRAARIRLALGTGLVTVPLTALGWALLSSPARSEAGLADALALTGLSAIAPLALAVAFVAADRRRRTA